jgi:hypothetical protein
MRRAGSEQFEQELDEFRELGESLLVREASQRNEPGRTLF